MNMIFSPMFLTESQLSLVSKYIVAALLYSRNGWTISIYCLYHLQGKWKTFTELCTCNETLGQSERVLRGAEEQHGLKRGTKMIKSLHCPLFLFVSYVFLEEA